MSWVKKVSIKPTKEIAKDVGRIMPNVDRLNGTFPLSKVPKGKVIEGKPSGNFPRSLTVGISRLNNKLRRVINIIAISCDGITLVNFGNP